MSHAHNSQMQEAIARVLRFREKMPNTLAAGHAAMDTAASIMDLVAAAGLALRQVSRARPERDLCHPGNDAPLSETSP